MPRPVRLLREDPGDLPLIIHMHDEGAFPVGDSGGDEHPGLGRRLVATLADVLILMAVDLVVIAFTLRAAGWPFTLDSLHQVQTPPLVVFYVALAWLYQAGLTFHAGQTLGKRLVDIAVVTSDGEAVPLGAAALRGMGWVLSVATLGVLSLPAAVDPQRRTAPDRLTGTRVVYAWRG